MLQSFFRTSSSRLIRSFRPFSSTTDEPGKFNQLNETSKSDSVDEFEPVTLSSNPYEKDKEQCILCREKVKLDYKNARLLQQFISSFSGRVYEQHVTGLCDKQYKTLLRTIEISRKAGYMPVFTKDPKYLRDPKLFDPMRPIRPHSFA
ncbi:unnamed protein product [Bursaphelenchus xylophilus]|uniref:(pine wood nematode) hypothetical protein n=1 Tax=Bursaphelenchus xylophilus TaxID=6326 RepID=A0A1I7SWU8_BURXY|nr:unnamed protein product [Bursaphelenchus xylophilus]CAG9099945.1 unnamed protein product [Bursaphelenchus xylophilus]